MDNGGVGVKLKLIRAQGKKVACRIQKKAVRQEDGSIRFNGAVIRNKNDVYNVDCAATGSNSGTPNDPKCPLLPIFLEIIFPMIQEMIQEGGTYAGYIPIIQSSRGTMQVHIKMPPSSMESKDIVNKKASIGSLKQHRCPI
jgi:hypothetical protein